MRYLLDTNTCIHLIKHHPPKIQKKLKKVPVGEVGISSIVLAELWFGVEGSAQKGRNEAALNDFLRYVVVLDWPAHAAPVYGRIRRFLKEKGAPIGGNDLLIAAHALALGTVLVTDNMKEFSRVPKLKIENWIER